MKGIGSYIQKKQKDSDRPRRAVYGIDEQTVMHLFARAVRDEYGRQGENNIVPKLYKNGTIFIAIHNAIWAQEIWLRREFFIKHLNKKIGNNIIKSIKIAT